MYLTLCNFKECFHHFDHEEMFPSWALNEIWTIQNGIVDNYLHTREENSYRKKFILKEIFCLLSWICYFALFRINPICSNVFISFRNFNTKRNDIVYLIHFHKDNDEKPFLSLENSFEYSHDTGDYSSILGNLRFCWLTSVRFLCSVLDAFLFFFKSRIFREYI